MTARRGQTAGGRRPTATTSSPSGRRTASRRQRFAQRLAPETRQQGRSDANRISASERERSMRRNATGKVLRHPMYSRVGIRKGPRGLLPAREQATPRRRAPPSRHRRRPRRGGTPAQQDRIMRNGHVSAHVPLGAGRKRSEPRLRAALRAVSVTEAQTSPHPAPPTLWPPAGRNRSSTSGTAAAFGALDRPAGETYAMRPGSDCAASPSLAAGAAALRGLRRIDVVKPDALGPNPERIAVGDEPPESRVGPPAHVPFAGAVTVIAQTSA